MTTKKTTATTKPRAPRKKAEPKTPEVKTIDVQRPQVPEAKLQYLVNPVTGERDPSMGVEYDWTAIRKKYKELGCPNNIFDPCHIPWESGMKYIQLASSRSVGKTTSCILFGLTMWWLTGGHTKIVYIRQHENQIEKKVLDRGAGLFSVIRVYNYISKLTDGRWENIEYYGREWRFTNLDPVTGKVIERSDPVMVCLDIDHNEIYKSSLQLPGGDFIIVDELLSSVYSENEFCNLMDLICTVVRSRLSPVVVCLFNNLSLMNPYLYEFETKKAFSALAEDEWCMVKTRKGTRIYCEYIGNKNEVKRLVNSEYFGFENEGLAAIVGGQGWVIQPAPHIWSDPTRETLIKGIILTYQENFIELEVCRNESVGLHICVHPLRRMPSDPKVIYTIGEIRQPREVYGFGTGRPIDDLVWKLYSQKKWYFAHNDLFSLVEAYYESA